MKILRVIFISLIVIVICFTILVPLAYYWDNVRFNSELVTALQNYTLSKCGELVKIEEVDFQWSLIGNSSVMWIASSSEGNFIGTIVNGKVLLEGSICESNLDLVLNRGKKEFIPLQMANKATLKTYTPPGPIVSLSKITILIGLVLKTLLISFYLALRKLIQNR